MYRKSIKVTVTESKPIVQEFLAKLTESIKREISYSKELADDRLTLEILEKRKTDGTELPLECSY